MHPLDLLTRARRGARRAFLARRFGAFGKGSTFDPTTSTINHYENFYVGRNVFIGRHAVFSANDVTVSIGDDTIIGPGLYIMTGDHEFDLPGKSWRDSGPGNNERIRIGRNVWIGARVTILKGVTIGDAAVIGAGSIVTRDVPPFAVVAGSPAQTIRWRFEGEKRRIHELYIERELSEPLSGVE